MASRTAVAPQVAAYSPGLLPGAQHVDVTSGDPEYANIKRDLDNVGLKMTRLVRLSNTVLTDKFQSESNHLMKVKQKGFSLNIETLYHGTTAPFDQICDEGLDERLSRRGRFGRGIYFSDNPKKCCKYSEHKNSKPYLLRCKVILGDVKEYPPGEQDWDLKREPIKTVKDGKRVYYDSVKGQPNDFTEYVIYDKRRALIEYIAFYDPLPPPAGSAAKNRSATTDATAVKHTPSSSSFSSTQSESDAGMMYAARRDSVSDDSIGSESGRNSPVDSDGGGRNVDEAVASSTPFYTDACNVPRVSAVRNRNRTKNGNSASAAVPSSSTPVAVAASSSSSAPRPAAGGTATTAASTLCPQVDLSHEVFASPHLAALRQLLDMKGKIPDAQHEALTREYHRTYLHGGLARSTDDDPVSTVMAKLIQEFKDVTQCKDTALCRRYIELGNMDLNRAIEAYIDTSS